MIKAQDTIFALASARGRSGVAVFRVSGPNAKAVSALCKLPAMGGRGLRLLKASDGSTIDEALVLNFDAGASFTGEPVVELHTHGSAAVTAKMFERLGALDGLRLAEPGEFTRRALENGRMDLSQVEGLSDLIDAETEAQRSQALALMQGGLSRKTDVWRKSLIHATALLEATIDFVDEDVPVDVTPEVKKNIETVIDQIDHEIIGSITSERVRDGFEVAIIGAPNVGKSTLLNAIAGRDVAITSNEAGTTRDIVEVRCDLDGLPVVFLDTAGIRESENNIEKQGVKRAIARARDSDLRIFLVNDPKETQSFDVAVKPNDEVILSKADLRENAKGISGVTGAGVSELLNRVTETLAGRLARNVTATRSRHRHAMEKAVGHLRAASDLLDSGSGMDELVSAELRLGIAVLDSLIGRVDVENILDVIFAEFCLGK